MSNRTYYIPTYAIFLSYLQLPQTGRTTSIPMLYSYHTYSNLTKDILHPYLCCFIIIPTKTSNQTYYLPTYAVFLSYVQRPQPRLTTYLHPYLCCFIVIPTKTSNQTYYLPTYALFLSYLQRPQTRLTTYLPTYAVFLSYNKDLNIQAPMVRTGTTKFAKRKRKFYFFEATTFRANLEINFEVFIKMLLAKCINFPTLPPPPFAPTPACLQPTTKWKIALGIINTH